MSSTYDGSEETDKLWGDTEIGSEKCSEVFWEESKTNNVKSTMSEVFKYFKKEPTGEVVGRQTTAAASSMKSRISSRGRTIEESSVTKEGGVVLNQLSRIWQSFEASP